MSNDKAGKKIRPQDKWDAKAGLAAKTYKVDERVAEEFQISCKKAGVAMGTQLTKMMKQFIEETKRASD